MNSRTLRSTVLLAGAALACFGFSTIARAEVPVTFTGGYSTIFSNSNCAFGVGIYRAKINGKLSSSKINCDDSRDEITTNQTWNASAYQDSSLTADSPGDTPFSNTNDFAGYAEVATLDSMMLGNIFPYSALSGITQPELTSAIWNVAAPGGVNGLDANATALVASVETTFSGNSTATRSYLGSLSNLWILTPNPHPGFGLNPHRMLIRHLNVPEGGDPLLYLLLAALSCFGAMFVSRRRSQTAQH